MSAGKTCEALQRLVHEAFARACPDCAHVLRASRQRVRAVEKIGGPDFECRAPAAAFRFLVASTRCAGEDDGDGKGRGKAATAVVRVRTVSEFGVVREAVFASAQELAEAIIESLPEEGRARALADVRVDAHGTITFVTVVHMQRQLLDGMRYCVGCGRFLRGEKGLRDHQLRAHGRTYEASQELVALSRMQMIHYTPSLAANPLPSTCPAREHAGDEGLEAARHGDLPRLRELVATGWDPLRAQDKHGSNALLWAAGGGHLETCKYLVEVCHMPVDGMWGPSHKKRRTALHWAARNGHLPVVEWLVKEKGVPADIATADGTTPLHHAVWQGHENVCAWLLDYGGASLAHQNGFGCNAVQWAAQGDSVQMCAFLQRRGLDLHLLNHNGHSALHKAAIKGKQRVCEWLVEEGGLGLAQMQGDLDGNTPEDMARLDGHEELGRWLAAKKQSLQAAQVRGLEPHHTSKREC